jgi:dihydrofolate reductase
MSLVVRAFSVSLDGFSAGPDQSLGDPLGVRGPELMQWFFPTRTWCSHQGMPGGETGTDDTMAAQAFENVGAWILGRNMFGPVRGPWPDFSWRGWWGEEPPYHCDVFVLTHHARPDLEMAGGTVFHFVTEGIERALGLAQKAAGAKDVRVGGGPGTVRQYLTAGLIDEMHLALSPVLMGAGEPLFAGLDLAELGYVCDPPVAGERATHMFVRKKG